MTKESKLALIIGFVLVLVVGVLVSDHFSQANQMSIDNLARANQQDQTPVAALGRSESDAINSAFATRANRVQAQRDASRYQPVQIPSSNPGLATRGGSILDGAIEYAKNKVMDTEFDAAASRKAKPIDDTPGAPRTRPYTVKSGDSLIGIARRYLGDPERYTEIEALNADVLGPDLLIRIGMELRLPADAQIITLGDRGDRPAESPGAPRVYTVKSGDTLGEIASRLLGTSKRTDEIVELNGLDSADTIFVGMTLQIPAQ